MYSFNTSEIVLSPEMIQLFEVFLLRMLRYDNNKINMKVITIK